MVPLDNDGKPTKNVEKGMMTFKEPVAMASVRAYMKLYKKVVRRTKGDGLLLTKFHQLLHLVHYICIHGSLMNIDGSRPEAIIKFLVKIPGRMTQNVAKVASFQVANKLVVIRDMDRFETAMKTYHPDVYQRFMKKKPGQECHDERTVVKQMVQRRPDVARVWCTQGSRFMIRFADDDSHNNIFNRTMRIQWTTGVKYDVIWNSGILASIEHELYRKLPNEIRSTKNVYNGFTEIIRYSRRTVHGDWERTILRAHPLYRSKTPWYSWTEISWSEEDIENDVTFPARILMFLQPDNDCSFGEHETVFSDENNTVNMFAIIQSAEKSVDRRTGTSLTGFLDDRFMMEDSLRIVSVDSLSRSVTVIEEDYFPQEKNWLVKNCIRIRSPDTWSNKFLHCVTRKKLL